MAKIDIQNIFKTKKFTELTNKEKISWIDHFFGDDRDEDTDPNPWDAAFGAGADSTSLIPGTDSMSQYDYFLDEMWNLRTKLMKQKADTVSSIKPSPEVSSVIDSVDSGTIGTSYPGSNLQNPQKLNIMNNVDGVIGNSYPGPALQNPQKLNIMHNLDGPIGKPYGMDQGVQRSFTEPGLGYPNTDDSGRRLQSFKEGNTNFGSLRDMAVKKYNTDAFNNEGIYYDGDTNAFGTPMDTNFEGESNFGLLRDRAVDKFNVQPYENDYPYNKKVNSTGDKDTPKPKLDRLGNVIEEDTGKNWFADTWDGLTEFSQDTVDYFKDTSWEDMQDDFVDSASDLGEWATANPVEALSYGLMMLPGIGWVGGIALKTAIGAGKIIMSPAAKIAARAVNTTKAKQPLVKLKELIVGRPSMAKNAYASGKGMRGAPATVPNTTAFRTAQETTRLNKLNAVSKAKEVAKAKAKADKLAGKIPNDPTKLTRGQMFNTGATRIGGTGVVATTANKELFGGGKDSAIGNILRGEVFGASELGTSINPTIDAVNSDMTQEQFNSLPSAGQDWWTALEEQDAQQMQAIRDYEIRNAAQQDVNARTALEDVPIDFSPFGPDFHQKKGTNVWTQFRNY